MGRKKFIEKLTDPERVTLQAGWKRGRSSDFRNRCKMLLLNDQGYTAVQIADILEVNALTVYKTMRAWKANGLSGLIRKRGQGRKPRLDKNDARQVAVVTQAVENNPQHIAVVLEDLSTQLGIEKVSIWTLQRFLKKLTSSGNASAKALPKSPAKPS